MSSLEVIVALSATLASVTYVAKTVIEELKKRKK